MSLIECFECRKQLSSEAHACPHCGSPTMKTKRKLHKKWHERTTVSLLILFLGIAVVFGFFHVITSSTLSFPRVILKGSFGYSETFINMDKITGMPWLAAKAKYPIGCRVLAKEGYIETDKEFHERVEREMDAELKEAQAEFMKEYDEFMKQYTKH